ncbi:MAG TPA: hypothetical protein VLM37_02205 [Fibrobacteraceae bacterium]|nr:hypothetical protein [Fibrobacteraceae bacterium]
MDARCIAEYAWQFRNRFKPFKPLCNEAQEIKVLLSLRDSVVKQRVAHSNMLKDMNWCFWL